MQLHNSWHKEHHFASQFTAGIKCELENTYAVDEEKKASDDSLNKRDIEIIWQTTAWTVPFKLNKRKPVQKAKNFF